jgi:predicted GIY-YIG superfamily endonuclease
MTVLLRSLRAQRSNLATGRGRCGQGLLCLHSDQPAQHREKLLAGFTNRYNVSKLVYYEAGYDASGAIAREKQNKAGSRQKKIDLINGFNPEWRDLYDDL